MALLLNCFISLFVVSSENIKFENAKIQLGQRIIHVELARTSEQQQQGLMNRKNLGKNSGMLFVFADEEIRSFWMKNTMIDLSIGFFDQQKRLVDIQEMKATNMMEARPPSYVSAQPAMYALEMNKGWFEREKIKKGEVFKFIH